MHSKVLDTHTHSELETFNLEFVGLHIIVHLFNKIGGCWQMAQTHFKTTDVHF